MQSLSLNYYAAALEFLYDACVAIIRSGTIEMPSDQLIRELNSGIATALHSRIANNSVHDQANNMAGGALQASLQAANNRPGNIPLPHSVGVLETANVNTRDTHYQGAIISQLQVLDNAISRIIDTNVPATIKFNQKVRKRPQSLRIRQADIECVA